MPSSSDSEEESILPEIPLYIAPKDLLALDEKTICTYVTKIQNVLKKKENKIKKLKTLIENCDHAAETTTNGEIVENVVNTESVANTDDNEAEAFANDAFSLVDEMRQAAAKAESLTNFVYEPTSGLYYDQQSGYYYNAEHGLYYDGNTGCYYSYNEAKGSYEFHSQVTVKPHQSTDTQIANKEDEDSSDLDDQIEFDESGGIITDKKVLRQIKKEKTRVKEEEKRRKKKARGGKKNVSSKRDYNKGRDHEDGELSTSDSSDSDANNSREMLKKKTKTDVEELSSNVEVFEKSNRFQAMAKKYPPSLRMIVRESSLDNLKVGSLHLITFKGGSLGREGNHDVIIPDANVSKEHLKFSYNEKKCLYQCKDLGSRNGTLLNGQSIGQTDKAKCDKHAIVHGSIIQIGSTKLLCHVHEGNTTCGLCEPGLLIEPTAQCSKTTTVPSNLTHKEQLKVLQKRYGLENEKYVETATNINDRNYNDRSATRRLKVGSSSDKEKTQMASVNTEISSENKGFKMLSKLGWSKGKTLGKTNANGLLEPINVVQYDGKQGLGSDKPIMPVVTLSKAEKLKIKNLNKTRERYDIISKAADIFDDSD